LTYGLKLKNGNNKIAINSYIFIEISPIVEMTVDIRSSCNQSNSSHVMSNESETSPKIDAVYRPKISLHFLVNNPAIILQINLSTKIALHLA